MKEPDERKILITCDFLRQKRNVRVDRLDKDIYHTRGTLANIHRNK